MMKRIKELQRGWDETQEELAQAKKRTESMTSPDVHGKAKAKVRPAPLVNFYKFLFYC